LEKVEWPTEQETWDRVMKKWKRIDYVNRKARSMVKSGEVATIKLLMFEEEEDVAEEMGEKDKGNLQ